MGEEKRHQMMQNLFGDQSEDDDDDIDSENDEYQRRPRYQSGEGEGEGEFEGDAEMEGQGEAEVESEGDHEGLEPDDGESEGERVGKETSDHRADSEGKEEAESEEEDSDPKAAATSIRRDKFVSSSEKSDGNGSAQADDMADDHGRETAESDEQEEYGQRTVSSRRKGVVASDSEESDDNRYRDNEEEEEINLSRLRRSPGDEEGKHRSRNAHTTDDIRDVFGDSDEDEQEDYTTQQEPFKSNMEDEENDGQDLRPEDMVQDEDMQYESEDNIEKKQKEKPMGPPLELEIPLRPPPGLPEKMNMIRVSNIMGIEPKPFDPKTYVEEDVFVTDDSGTRKRIRLKDNIVRWRNVRKPDGTLTKESNARFVRWSDGSLQLLIGNEVLDISVQEAQHDQTHLFLRHAKGLLQSQGRLLKKMRFMPSSLSSKSHRLLTALVDSRNKKVYKVKNCVTDIDPEREKEEKEKAEGQTIRANVLLHRKWEKINRKYVQSTERGRQLSPRYLNALDEDDEQEDYYAPRGSRRRLDEDFEETEAEKRIMNAKRPQVAKNVRPKPSSVPATRRRGEDSYESESEESEYETPGDDDEDDRYTSRKRSNEREDKYDESDQEIYADEESDEEVEEEPKAKSKQPKESLKRKEIGSDSESSPRKRTTQRRRAVVYDSDDE